MTKEEIVELLDKAFNLGSYHMHGHFKNNDFLIKYYANEFEQLKASVKESLTTEKEGR